MIPPAAGTARACADAACAARAGAAPRAASVTRACNAACQRAHNGAYTTSMQADACVTPFTQGMTALRVIIAHK